MDYAKLTLLLFNSYPLFFIITGLYIFKYINLTQIICGYFLYCLYIQIFSKTLLYYTKTERNDKILKSCPNLLNPNYKPHFFLPFCTFQMIVCGLWKPKKSKDLKFNVENVNKYGTKLFWASFSDMKEPLNTQPILILFPGMTGIIDDGYVQNIIIEGLNKGYNVVIFQMRILSEDFSLNETGVFKLYEDIDEAINLINTKYNKAKIFAIGGSYGANNLVYYLGHINNINKKIHGAVSISNPYDMELCERFLEDTIFSLLITFLERENFKKIKYGAENCKNHSFNIELISECEDMKSYDEEFSRKIFGYKSADDYYRNISALRKIENINIPLLCINAKDDGLTSCRAIPYDDIRLNENIFLLVADKGAHMCFFSNEKISELKQWHLKPIFEFLKSCQNLDEIKF